jgi:hypothetical protein
LSIADFRFEERPPLWRLTNVLFKVRNGALPHRDVKNEDRSGYVYENTENNDKMSGEETRFYTKMHHLREDQQESVGFLGRECISYTVRQDGRWGETVGIRCGCQGPGQALRGSLREAINLRMTVQGQRGVLLVIAGYQSENYAEVNAIEVVDESP